MKKCYKLALLTGPIFSNNMGCNALTYGSVGVLSEVARKMGAAFEFYLVGNPSSGVIPPELESHHIHFVDQLHDLGVKGLLRCAYNRNYRQVKRYAGALAKTDLFVDNAGGDSFSDIYGPARFESVLRHFNYALKRGKPLILLPQTIGPFKSEKVRSQAREILKKAAAVFARDPLSVQCVKELAPDIDVFETIDVAMFMPYQKRQIAGKKGLVVGLNPSGLLWKGGYTGNNQFGLKEDYKTIIREVIKYLLSINNVTVELIGHDITGPNAGNLADDYYICKLLQKEFPACKVGPFFYSPIEAKSYISGLDLLIGSRMHCCIAAYSSGVPVFPLAYSRKFKGLFVEKLDYPYLSELTEDNSEKTLAGLKDILSCLENINAQMLQRLQDLENYKKELIDHMSTKLSQLL